MHFVAADDSSWGFALEAAEPRGREIAKVKQNDVAARARTMARALIKPIKMSLSPGVSRAGSRRTGTSRGWRVQFLAPASAPEPQFSIAGHARVSRLFTHLISVWNSKWAGTLESTSALQHE